MMYLERDAAVAKVTIDLPCYICTILERDVAASQVVLISSSTFLLSIKQYGSPLAC
jgi:hypothetical protein